MSDVKSVFESKTIWGGLLAFAAPVIAHFLHISITDVDVQQISETIAGVIGAIGGLIAIYGRIRATKVIGA